MPTGWAAEDVWLLPGWHNSDAGHWQSRWEQRHGYRRLEQNDWDRPLRGDWSARLQETVLDAPRPVVLVPGRSRRASSRPHHHMRDNQWSGDASLRSIQLPTRARKHARGVRVAQARGEAQGRRARRVTSRTRLPRIA